MTGKINTSPIVIFSKFLSKSLKSAPNKNIIREKLIMNFLKVCSSGFEVSGAKTLYVKRSLDRIKRLGFERGYTTIGTPGAGAGKGGGAGGSVKESGGGLGRFAAAQEEGFFYNQQQEQIKKMKQKLKAETEKPVPEQKPTK